MELSPVKSSFIEAVGYDEPSKKLSVRFHTGETWDYQPVPAEIHTGMIAAESVGIFFHTRIRGRFSSKMVGKSVGSPVVAQLGDKWVRTVEVVRREDGTTGPPLQTEDIRGKKFQYVGLQDGTAYYKEIE